MKFCWGKIHLGGVFTLEVSRPAMGWLAMNFHPRRAQCLHRLHKAGLYAGNIRKDTPGLEQVAVGAKTSPAARWGTGQR